MDIDYFLVYHIGEQAYDQPNSLFWVRTVVDAMSLIGPDTDDNLERMIQQLLVHHAGTGSGSEAIDGIRHEIVRLRGVTYWGDSTPLGLKYRCLNAIASSQKRNAVEPDSWQYGIVTAFQNINFHHGKDEALIAVIRKNASKHGVNLYQASGSQ